MGFCLLPLATVSQYLQLCWFECFENLANAMIDFINSGSGN